VINRITPEVKIIFLCSPNNPTGNLLATKPVIDILDSFKGIVVVDEAYNDFTTDKGYLPYLTSYDNLVVLQTFSKAWGLAGARVGMAFAHEAVIGYLNKIKPPYNLSILSQQAVLKKLNAPEQVTDFVKAISGQREWLIGELGKIREVVHIFPSEANFVLVRISNARALFEYLLGKGIIVRDRSSIRHGEDCLRFTIGLASENQQLINEIKKFYA
jgi:histidinol-phosphate aminotransferase